MSVRVTIEQLARLAPAMRPAYREAFRHGQPVLDRWAISANPRRISHFLAQVLHESRALTTEFEQLAHSADRLARLWPKRFGPRGATDPAPYVRSPRKLANLVYGGRMGNDGADDGYVYRGRGMLKLTGKVNYARATALVRASMLSGRGKGEAGRYGAGAALQPDFVARPDAVLDADWGLEVAAAIWHDRGCNELADHDALDLLTQRINGDGNGLVERMQWRRHAAQIWE